MFFYCFSLNVNAANARATFSKNTEICPFAASLVGPSLSIELFENIFASLWAMDSNLLAAHFVAVYNRMHFRVLLFCAQTKLFRRMVSTSFLSNVKLQIQTPRRLRKTISRRTSCSTVSTLALHESTSRPPSMIDSTIIQGPMASSL